MYKIRCICTNIQYTVNLSQTVYFTARSVDAAPHLPKPTPSRLEDSKNSLKRPDAPAHAPCSPNGHALSRSLHPPRAIATSDRPSVLPLPLSVSCFCCCCCCPRPSSLPLSLRRRRVMSAPLGCLCNQCQRSPAISTAPMALRGSTDPPTP